jgi:pimeloyl-ACP methyl ester carboxylesterase
MVNDTSLAIDRTIPLTINGSRQTVRLSGTRPGLPPLLIVQGGPGLPLLNEVWRFRRLLDLERDVLVAYWDQRGCGDASNDDASGVSLARQVDDLRAVLQWLHGETGQPARLLGISIGATIALRAAEHEASRVKAVIAVSPDSHTGRSDAAADAFLREQAGHAGHRVQQRVTQLPGPPYLEPDGFQHRARLLADLGTIERRKRFSRLIGDLLITVFRTYGVTGGMRALRNMNTVLRTLLPEVAAVDLLAHPPRVTVPVHYVFGEQDALVTAAMIADLSSAIGAPGGTVRCVCDAGHMVHFDQPAIVRSIVVQRKSVRSYVPSASDRETWRASF